MRFALLIINDVIALWLLMFLASPKSPPKERTLTLRFFRTLSFREGRVRL